MKYYGKNVQDIVVDAIHFEKEVVLTRGKLIIHVGDKGLLTLNLKDNVTRRPVLNAGELKGTFQFMGHKVIYNEDLDWPYTMEVVRDG